MLKCYFIDVRNKRSANIGSDHRLVIAEVKIKITQIAKKKNGTLLTNEDEPIQRWHKHFSELFTKPPDVLELRNVDPPPVQRVSSSIPS